MADDDEERWTVVATETAAAAAGGATVEDEVLVAPINELQLREEDDEALAAAAVAMKEAAAAESRPDQPTPDDDDAAEPDEPVVPGVEDHVSAGGFAGTEYEALGERLSSGLALAQAAFDAVDASPRHRAAANGLSDELMNILGALHLLALEGAVVARGAPLYDFSPAVRGSGFRSILHLVDLAAARAQKTLRGTYRRHARVVFFASTETEGLADLRGMLRTLGRLTTLAARLVEHGRGVALSAAAAGAAGSPFVPLPGAERVLFVREVLEMSRDDFHGPLFGFYYDKEVRLLVKLVSVAMASYSHGNRHTNPVLRHASSLLHGGLYFLRPKLKAKQFVSVSRSGDMLFAKAFWNLLETSSLVTAGRVRFVAACVRVYCIHDVCVGSSYRRASRRAWCSSFRCGSRS
jgi:hypothetical protein